MFDIHFESGQFYTKNFDHIANMKMIQIGNMMLFYLNVRKCRLLLLLLQNTV
jgi:hypothetical protein